ncbi:MULTISPECIES: YrhB domain-containing protein [unclassified Rhizobium]|uniref:YrhB domain-containing protein n=1 Tax=unclassified Rhizobium TaxID=2613769 RepID=UPI00071469A4|nr:MULTISPECIES: YrhB domain-containing protein [unclassified Rhizobium]KQS89664.1 hypothetical protein ASG42_13335 [Rhizobium sp. Leaf391]KQS94944.1 hypothetical protein ASG50_27285 [Rhizobium sp. Leaf386]KQU01320.1 hypothetical protein ASG68_06065 [Rhizobium sp. Leaf453]
MLTFSKARRLAETWVEVTCGKEVELIRDAAIAKPYGWVFFYQSSAHLRDPDDFSSALIGNSPFLIDRDSGEIKVFGMARDTAFYLKEFESTLPPGQIYRKPEQPIWS